MPHIDFKSFAFGVIFVMFLLPLILRFMSAGKVKLNKKR